jgi:bifunctional non-homologous end joining protein LigD
MPQTQGRATKTKTKSRPTARRAGPAPRRTISRSAHQKLATYRKKRDFGVTPEPATSTRPLGAQGLSFVIQKHAARNLHYDFRLELDGVLLSWSVPKGPTLKPGDRRLAVRTEDHPLDYADFEGIIPKGEYGGGTVIVWDRGSWQPEDDPRSGLKKGRLTFTLEGEKLRGRWHLVRTRAGDDKRENWLLFKSRDEASRDGAEEASITELRPESVQTGRSIEDVAGAKDRVWHSSRSDEGKSPKRTAKSSKRAASVRPADNPTLTLKPAPEARRDVLSLVKQLPVQFPLTNLTKVLYPEPQVRKADLIAYLVAISDWMLPHLGDRPLTLVRCPNGPREHCFFQKHAKDTVPPVVKRVAISEEKGEQDYMRVNDPMGLVALAQLGALELHSWQCHADDVEAPDRLVFDLDPDEKLGWDAVRDAALDVRARLEKLGLESFVMTTGGKGLHVVAPVQRRLSWDEHKAFSKAFAEQMARAEPQRYVSNIRKDLRKGRIFVDYLRNGRGATSISPYSPRARSHASVATPLTWEELEAGVDPASFTIKTVIGRVHQLEGDPWDGYFELKQSVVASARKSVSR